MQPNIYAIEAIGKGSILAMAKPQSGDQIESVFEAIAARGVTRILSLLEVSEAAGLGLQYEMQLTQSNGMQFVQFSIPDLGVPISAQAFSLLVKQQYVDAKAGHHILVHCRAGIGRTGMVTAGVLMHCGYDALAAFDRVSKKRGESVPDLPAQIDWVVENQQRIIST